MQCYSHTVSEQFSPSIRLDRYVSKYMYLLSRSQLKVRDFKAKINGKNVKLSSPVKHGDFIELFWDDAPPENIEPQDIPLDIIYEDEKQIVINKVQGMVVHPGAGNKQGTLANAILYRMLKLYSENLHIGIRPGIVHRLDKDTSGVIIAAYNEEVHAFLADQFKSRKTKKKYIAIVTGSLKEMKGKIETFISRDINNRKRFNVSSAGRNAVTLYKVIKSWKNYSLVLLCPKTGRTHQLRVHMKHIGNPILGDPIYGSKDKLFPDVNLMLHSKSLAITLFGEQTNRIFSAPLPIRFLSVIDKLNRHNSDGY